MIVNDWARYEPLFYKFEFDCKHSGKNEMQAEFMDLLTAMRKSYGKPMQITSGYRDKSHPIEARKTGSGGEHTEGLCCDVGCTNSKDRFQLVRLALDFGFHRIGIHPRFIHLGISNSKPTNVLWEYR